MSAGGSGGGGYGYPPGGHGPPGGYGPPGGQGPQAGYGPPGGQGPQAGYGPPAGHGPPPGYGPPPGAWHPPAGGFAPMPANFPPGYTPDSGTPSLEGGVPWEHKGGNILTKWWATMTACNSHTRPFFAAVAQNEKGDCVTFSMVSGAISGAALGLLYILLFGALSAGLLLGLPAGGKGGPGAMSGAMAAGFSIGIGIVYAILITVSSAIGAVARPFIWGGLHHILLMLFGGVGERRTFMHTVRVAAYAEGASMPWIWIPIAGPFIAAFYGIKNIVVGYDEVHRCGIGKAVLVLSAPVLCCCGCNALAMALGLLPAIMRP